MKDTSAQEQAATARAGDFEPTPAPLRGLSDEKHAKNGGDYDDGFFSIAAVGRDVKAVDGFFLMGMALSFIFFGRRVPKKNRFGANL